MNCLSLSPRVVELGDVVAVVDGDKQAIDKLCVDFEPLSQFVDVVGVLDVFEDVLVAVVDVIEKEGVKGSVEISIHDLEEPTDIVPCYFQLQLDFQLHFQLLFQLQFQLQFQLHSQFQLLFLWQ